jgi:hypothetical protein
MTQISFVMAGLVPAIPIGASSIGITAQGR